VGPLRACKRQTEDQLTSDGPCASLRVVMVVAVRWETVNAIFIIFAVYAVDAVNEIDIMNE
jgi:hypothetical protein